MDKTQPDFANYNIDGTFNSDTFFNWQELNKEEVYMQYVRDAENHGIGGINPGSGYVRSADFNMCIVSSAESEEEVAIQVSKIPGFAENFVTATIV